MEKSVRIICLFGLFAFLLARPVDILTARAVALCVFPQKTFSTCISVSDYLYLSTFKQGGFILSSADDAFPPILAYSEHAHVEEQHPAFRDYCAIYTRQIQEHLSVNDPVHPDWNIYLKPSFQKTAIQAEVLPLLTTTWNQSPHYNNKFPYFVTPTHTDEQALVGCVAVVMGQLMRYYEHPQRGIGRRWYYSNDTDSILSAWHDTTYYDWENMPDSLSTRYGILTAPADQVEDVSHLLYQSAVSVDMELKPGASSASYDDMMYALVSYFDYSSDMVYDEAENYGLLSEWINVLKQELDGGYPIPYRGQGSGGHAFLCDGYRMTTDTHFHFNWGWGGSCDGWFLLTALNPLDDRDYTTLQGAIMGVRPNTDNITRFAYTGFEGYQAGWIYDGFSFVGENGINDMVHSGNYSYAFDALNQWLISPKIHIPNDDNAELSFWAKMLNSGKQCKVLLSQTDTLRSSFTVDLGTISPHNQNWGEYTFNLRPYKNTDIYIGFEYLSNNGYITLDDFMMSMPKVEDAVVSTQLENYALLQVYPNPFNPKTTVSYKLSPLSPPAGGYAGQATFSNINVSIFNLQGVKVCTLVNQHQDPGTYTLFWDATAYPSGIYFCSLNINGKLQSTQKMVLVK